MEQLGTGILLTNQIQYFPTLSSLLFILQESLAGLIASVYRPRAVQLVVLETERGDVEVFSGVGLTLR